jgi:hypothetical protein
MGPNNKNFENSGARFKYLVEQVFYPSDDDRIEPGEDDDDDEDDGT